MLKKVFRQSAVEGKVTLLTISEYEEYERKGLSELPNQVVEAFQPVIYQQIGYPSRVARESELVKYVDVMQELRFDDDFDNLLGGISEDEFSLVKRLTELVADFTRSKFGTSLVARSTIMRSLNVLRHIKFIFGDNKPPIFEIGPGCGYLGAMLIMESYPYAATDVSQAFYLYQNHLWNHVSGGSVSELLDEIGENPFPLEPGRATHIPWWQFVQLRKETSPEFDIVTSNHCLAEMHPDSLGFALKTSQTFFRNSNRPVFLFEGWGTSMKYNRSVIAQRFYRSGFGLIHNDPYITAMVPKERSSSQSLLSEPNHKSHIVRRGISLTNRIKGRPNYGPYEPPVLISLDDPVGNAIVKGREQLAPLVGVNRLRDLYEKLVGDPEPLTADERFLIMARRN